MENKKIKNIDEYIMGYPKETQQVMQELRALIKKVVPKAIEKIHYGMAAFFLGDTYVVYFAGYKNHIGLYPVPVKSEEFKEEFANYKTGRGSIQFPLSKPLPVKLITRIVKHLTEKSKERIQSKQKR